MGSSPALAASACPGVFLHSSAWAAAASQTDLKFFSLLVSCVPSPVLQLDALGCYVRENVAKLAFSEVQNNVSERMVSFEGKKKKTEPREQQDMTEHGFNSAVCTM